MPRDLRRIGRRPDDDEVVVHDVEPLARVALGDELVFGLAGVDQQHVGVAAAADLDRLPGADRDDVHPAAQPPLERRQDGRQQTRCRRCSSWWPGEARPGESPLEPPPWPQGR